MGAGKILVAAHRTSDLKLWAGWLGAAGFCTRQCSTANGIPAAIRDGFEVLFIGLYTIDGENWLASIDQLRDRFPALKVAVIAVESSEDLAVHALHAGVHEYVRAPISASTLEAAARRISQPNSGHPGDTGKSPPTMLGDSQSVCNLRLRLERLAGADCNVLITGESGTGKELAAAALHRQSPRRAGRLVCVNCAAIPDALVESELFGRERGAFTGADSQQDGKLKAADGGVIFLDEVGDLSLYAQAKILRAVETREIYRLGSHRPIAFDARIVSATHRNLEEMVRLGQFRQDLFFRLNVGRVHVPALRERIEDLHLLVNYYLARLNPQMATHVEAFSSEAWECLARYSWPGNIRELRNLLESVLVNSTSSTISADELPANFRLPLETVRRGERDDLVEALLATNWNKSKAAEKLQWSRMKLYRKMARHAVSGTA
jgi:DNA-binding NtrC family response regulator